MKQIESYRAPKYESGMYSPVEDGIYRVECDGETLYVTSLSFVQEPELEEGGSAAEISQYPLNTEQSQVCVQEFASPDLEDIRKLRTIIGKHVFNKEIDGYIKLVIE